MTESITLFGTGDHVRLSPNFREIYSNVFRTSCSNWDVQLTFTRAKTNAKGETEMEEQVTIFVTPAQAKAVSAQMQIAVKQYESEFGEIEIPGGTRVMGASDKK